MRASRSRASSSDSSGATPTSCARRGRSCTSTSPDALRVVVAQVAQRAELAARRAGLAEFLTVAAEEDRRLDAVRHLAGGGDRRLVRLRVILRLRAEAEAEEHAQRVRVGRERALLSVEEEDLVGHRLADAGILAEDFLVEGDADLLRQARAGDDFLRAMRRQHAASFDDLGDLRGRRGEDRLGLQSDLVAQFLERLAATRVVDEIGDVLEEDHFVRIGDARALPAVEATRWSRGALGIGRSVSWGKPSDGALCFPSFWSHGSKSSTTALTRPS